MAQRAEKVLAFPSKHSCSPDYQKEINQFATWIGLTGNLSLVEMSLQFQRSLIETSLWLTGGDIILAASRLGMSAGDLRYQLAWRFPELEGQVRERLKLAADY